MREISVCLTHVYQSHFWCWLLIVLAISPSRFFTFHLKSIFHYWRILSTIRNYDSNEDSAVSDLKSFIILLRPGSLFWLWYLDFTNCQQFHTTSSISCNYISGPINQKDTSLDFSIVTSNIIMILAVEFFIVHSVVFILTIMIVIILNHRFRRMKVYGELH